MQEKEREISPIKQNILKYLDYKGITQYQCYKDTGITRGVLAQPTGISEDNIARFLAYYKDISIEWLITGQGEMLKGDLNYSKSESPFITSVSETPKVERIYHPKSFERTLDVQDIPLYSFDVTGGILENLDDSAQFIEGTIRIPDAPKCDGAVRVVGNSMTPIVNPGDIIAFSMLNSLDYLLYGQIYFVDYSADASNNFLVCKIVKKSDRGDDYISLHSANPSHDPVDIPRSSVRHIAIVKLSIHYHMIL